MELKGYMGKRLRINLTNKRENTESIEDSTYRKFIGGRGINIKLMFDEISSNTDPLSENNLLIFGVGPLVGTSSLFANRLTISGKSPLTGFLGDSNIGGGLANEFKSTGYDQMVISGKSSDPIYLVISENEIKYRDATHLWGKKIPDASQIIKQEINEPKSKIACIGPAGENLVRFANIMVGEHAAGRTGLGAIMGSKNLKAIVFVDSKKAQIHNNQGLSETMKKLVKSLNNDPEVEKAGEYGDAPAVESLNSIGALEVKNCQTGIMENVEKISGKNTRDDYKIKSKTCPSCPIHCRALSLFDNDEFGTYVIEGPSYGALQSFGARIGNTNIHSIAYMLKLSNEYGLDFMSFCGIISWLMECYENGAVDKKDLDGLELPWGNYKNTILLMDKIANRRGVGDLLGEGAYRASEDLGKETKEFLLTIKNMEFENFDPRAYKGRGVGFGTSSRGADNTRSLSAIESSLTEKRAKKLFGSREAASLTGVKGKGKLLKYTEDLTSISALLGLCKFGIYYYVSDIDEINSRSELTARAFAHVTGMVDPNEALNFLIEAGERLRNIERLFNLREGLKKEDDLLPKRFRKKPMPEGPAKGNIVENRKILKEYYEARGWDVEKGTPKDKTLSRLNLSNEGKALKN